MKTFSHFIGEAKNPADTGVMTPKQMVDHIGAAKVKLIAKHKWFQQYFAHIDNIGMKYSSSEVSGLESVKVVRGPQGDDDMRVMAEFHFGVSGRKIDNVRVFTNINNTKASNGQLVWKPLKSEKE